MKASPQLIALFHQEHAWFFVSEREGADAAFKHWSFGHNKFNKIRSNEKNPYIYDSLEFHNWLNGYFEFYVWIAKQESFITEFHDAKQKLKEADLHV